MTSPTEHMNEALTLAKKGLLTTRPNPMVGCVTVSYTHLTLPTSDIV